MNKFFITIALLPISLYSMDKLSSEERLQLIKRIQTIPYAERLKINNKIQEFTTANRYVPVMELNHYRSLRSEELKQILEHNSIPHPARLTFGWIEDIQKTCQNVELQDPQEAATYLKAALADEDERVFLLALRDVLEARSGNIADLAEETNLNKQNLYRMLSTQGNLCLTSLKTVLNAIGFEMDITPIKK